MKYIYRYRYLISFLIIFSLIFTIIIINADNYRSIMLLHEILATHEIIHALEVSTNYSIIIGVLAVTFFVLAFLALSYENSRRQRAENELHRANQELDARVKQRTEELVKANLALRHAYDETIEGWSRALDLRDKETEGHSERVTEMTLRLASVAGMNDDELVHVRRGALLHDIGKMGIRDKILQKPGKLTDEEWIIMRKHPKISYTLLSPIIYLQPALDIPYCHHEKWDGTGYPRGLKGEQIPLAARLFAVVDIWDALRYDRPYRKGWDDKDVLEYIESLAGTHLDPMVVMYFLSIVREE